MSNFNVPKDVEIEKEEMKEKKMEKEENEEESYETIRYLLMSIETILYKLNKLIDNMYNNCVQRSLSRRPKTSIGYDYVYKILQENPINFQQVYRIYRDAFLNLCTIIREKTLLQDTGFICIEEMLATFLLTVGQNSQYYMVRETFSRSHFTTSKNFNKVLKVLNTIAIDIIVKPKSTVPERIRESIRFYPYFKDCIGAIDGTHIPAMVRGHDTSSYHNCHGIISQNVLAVCNFDLDFMYVLSGWIDLLMIQKY